MTQVLTLLPDRHAPPETLDKSDKDVIVTFMIVFLSPNYVNNPFLKAKFMSVSNELGQPNRAGDTDDFEMFRCWRSVYSHGDTSARVSFTTTWSNIHWLCST
jgi:hypothetical protein